MSTSTVTEESPFIRLLEITLDTDEVRTAVQQAAQKLSQRVRVPGFRPGKIPMRALKMHLGAEKVEEEIKERLISLSYSKSFQTHGLEPVGVLEVDAPGVTQDQPYTYKVKVEIFPPIDMPDFATLGLTAPEETASDEEIAKALEGIQKENATTEVVDRPAKATDWISFSIVSAPAGHEAQVEAIKDQRYVVKLDQRVEGDAFLENMPGKKVGEKVSFTTAISAGFPVQELAGAEGEFTFEMMEVREPSLPAVDEALAQQLKHESVDHLKETLQRVITRNKQREADRAFGEEIMKTLLARTAFDVSDTMLDREIESVKGNIAQKTTLEDAAKNEGLSVEDFEKKLHGETLDYLKRQLLLRQVMSKNNIHVHQEEMLYAIMNLAENAGLGKNEARELMKNEQIQEEIHERLLQEKTMKFIRDSVAGKNPAACDHDHGHTHDHEHEHEHEHESHD